MKESPLMIKSKVFALDVIKVCKDLRNAKCESTLINQFLRSGTEYWIELIIESGYYNNKTLLEKCIEIKRILIASLNTAKENK